MVVQLFTAIGNFIGSLLSMDIPGLPGFTFLHLMVIGFILAFVGVIFRVTMGGGGSE